MNLKSFFIFSLSTLALCACDDTLTDIGSSVRPDTDDLIIKSSAFNVSISSYKADSIYVRTSTPLLGRIDNPTYGTITSDYASTMRIEPGLNLDVYDDDSLVFDFDPDKNSLPIGDKIDSMVLSISYINYFGDSISPMAATAYELTQKLPSDPSAFYSNVDFSPYITPLQPIGSAGYTAVDLDLSDSIRNEENYIPYVDIPLNQELVDRFYNEFKNNPSTFDNQDSFQEFFPGIYVTNTFGNGSILQVTATSIGIFYKVELITEDQDGNDSVYIAPQIKVISVTPDVVQLNKTSNPISEEANEAILNSPDTAYITTPGGYYTEIALPIQQMVDTINSYNDAINVFLNGANFNLLAYDANEDIFEQKPPTYALLIEKSEIKDFFEGNKVPDNETSFLAALPTDSTDTSYGYNFGNLNQLVEKYRKGFNDGSITPTDSIEMAVIPVTTIFDQQNNITRVTNYFLPGGTKLKKGAVAPKIDLVYTIQTEQ